ncbi:hypothetical protein BOX15_Mlig028578g2, partial [Macrostomum lignano]
VTAAAGLGGLRLSCQRAASASSPVSVLLSSLHTAPIGGLAKRVDIAKEDLRPWAASEGKAPRKKTAQPPVQLWPGMPLARLAEQLGRDAKVVGHSAKRVGFRGRLRPDTPLTDADCVAQVCRMYGRDFLLLDAAPDGEEAPLQPQPPTPHHLQPQQPAGQPPRPHHLQPQQPAGQPPRPHHLQPQHADQPPRPHHQQPQHADQPLRPHHPAAVGGAATVISSSQDFDPDDPEAALLHPASDAADSPQNLARRPPVVAILGHVDHGKTTLLDRLRHSRLVEAEFGGITQRIGAFTVQLPQAASYDNRDGCITFLDTPGHAAFSNMRQRGASATDIAVLVVAADDGVMPQTLESLRYISAAGVPMVVAVNKVDKREAQPDSVMQELSKHGVLVEELGGDVQCVPVSALKGSGVERLLEAVLALAELLELRANMQGRAEGVVIESGQSKGLGKTASLLCTRGCVKPGTVLVAGRAFCRVRRMTDDLGRPVDRLLPGRAAEIAGWRQLPSAGESALEAASERLARAVIAQRERRAVEAKSAADAAASEEARREWQRAYSEHLAGLADMSIRERRRHKASDELADTARQLMDSKFAHGTEPRLSLTIRADADGSLEAILGLLSGYADPRCHLDLVSFEVGPPTISDVETLADFDGLLCCFNVPVPQDVSTAAAAAGVPVVEHRVVYHMIADLKARLTAALPPKEEERPIGSADVLQVFHVSGPGGSHHKVAVAGCACKSGQLSRKKHFRLVRNGQTVFTGRCASLRHLKSTVETVRSGMECGVQLDLPAGVSYLPGDQIVCFETVAVPQSIDWEPGFGLEDEADP